MKLKSPSALAAAMAGGVAKAFGIILTFLGGFALVLGTTGFFAGAFVVAQESEGPFASEERIEAAAVASAVGLAAMAGGFLLLLLGLPLLVWGLQREDDPQTGRARTRQGGALLAWAFTLLVLGGIALLLGLAAAAIGAAVLEEESGRLAPSEERAELAAVFGVGGLAVAGLGALLVVTGIPFAVGARSRADRAPAGAALRWSPSATALSVGGGAAVVLLALFLTVAPGGPLMAAAADEDGGVVTLTFEGRIAGVMTPAGALGAAVPSEGEHVVSAPYALGIVEAGLEWESATDPTLVLVLETQDDQGGWREIARATGNATLLARSGAVPLGDDVRARVSFADGSGGDVEYALVVRVSPE